MRKSLRSVGNSPRSLEAIFLLMKPRTESKGMVWFVILAKEAARGWISAKRPTREP